MPICNAKSKSTGLKCKARAINGSKKCHYHGGKSTGAPKGSKKLVTPGSLYSQYLSGDDLKNFNGSQSALGTVDTELQLNRMRLARVVRIQQEREEVNDHLQTEEESGYSDNLQIKRKLIDYDGLILRYTVSIDRLEQRRAELMKVAEDTDTEPLESKDLLFGKVDGRKLESD